MKSMQRFLLKYILANARGCVQTCAAASGAGFSLRFYKIDNHWNYAKFAAAHVGALRVGSKTYMAMIFQIQN